MATIRVRDWTKEQIERIREAESHSSHDSVIKTLLKDRELAKFAENPAEETPTQVDRQPERRAETAFDDLTVLEELEHAKNGIIFLWCPNCANEVAHLGLESAVSLSVFEAECQRCLTRLDQYAIVAIEVGYPIEKRVMEGTVEDDLKGCVIDCWNRTLEAATAGTLDGAELDEERRVLKYNDYLEAFGWSWPTDVPVVGIEPDHTYRNEATGSRIEVTEKLSDTRGSLSDYRIRTPDGESDVLESGELLNFILGRNLYLVDDQNEQADTPANAD